ncbi:MAG: hypothetical protein LBS52_00735 [Dysgonamonadaceae bacterium]|jgi:hypothetical protein|nr:hypothetical protein [Dysgonamonadaceae bacterium]
MKTKVFFFLAIFAASILVCNAQDLKGTWKAVSSSGNTLPEGFTNIKMITPTHFIWIMSDKDGNIVSGSGGTYTAKDGVYTETILYTLPGMKNWKGKKGVYKYEIINGKLTISGELEFDENKKVKNEEVWENIDKP